MRPTQLLAGVLAATSVASAWSWNDDILGKGVHQFEGMLYGRADSKTTSTDKSASGSSSASGSGSGSSSGSGSGTGTGTGTAAKTTGGTGTGTAAETGKGTTASGSGTAKPSGTDSGNQTTKSFDNRLPAGGVSMVTPAATTTTFLKIGDWWTFAWNYTSLSVTPSKVDVYASCSAKQSAWPIKTNMTVQRGDGDVQEVLWDTNSLTAELVMETYTLLIYDAASDVSATAAAGYFAPQTTYTFPVYSGQAYTPRDQWQCIACSPGNKVSAQEKQTWFFLFTMAGISVLSFTWFASGVFGVF